ncbi:MAG: 5'-nucleotidase C-terminal domain-containing protein [Oscillospiraceae bacterium]|nr:5'-nucleotidase C-terminal domain-containing protein [Oscillospiraceae bacterium]
MNKIFKRVMFFTAAATISLTVSAMAADEAANIHLAAFYDDNGVLVGVKSINGELSDKEVDVLADACASENVEMAKVFSWTEELKPIGDSGRIINLSEDENTVVILHTNDMHGSLVGSSSVIGSDRVATLKIMEDAILADGGDATQGVALASLSQGADVIDIMSAAGYDVMAAGNHEFDYGFDILAKNRQLAAFPIISANTYYEGAPLFAGSYNGGETNGENIIIEKNGIKIGIFALTTVNTATSTKPDGIVGVEFKDEVETAKEQVKKLDEQGADVIIALTHMGVNPDAAKCTSRQLAEAMADTKLNAIIDGHSHTVVGEVDSGIVIGQTGTAGANVGRMEITVDADGNVSVDEVMLTRAFFDNIEPDAATASKIDNINSKQSETLKTVIGETKNTLWGGSINQISEARVGETNLGDIICDSMIYSVKQLVGKEYQDIPIIAVENGGGFRTAIPNGNITMGSAVNTLPFANTVMYKAITPSVLYTYLEDSVSSVTAQDTETGFLIAGYSGSFPQIGGFCFEYDPNAATGEKVKRIILGDTELERNDTETKLIIASNDYVIGQDAFKDIPTLGEGSGLTQAVVDYISYITGNGTKPISIATAEGRIKTVGEYTPKDYTAHVRLNGNVPAEGSELKAYVDGTAEATGTVAAGGVLDITVSDGPHAIKLYDDQNEVYVNNYSGNGVIEKYGDLYLGYPALEVK